ncbi:MAG: YggT family protein [Alphaproteobacteria bacterium]|nr:YggT family protein [Alphaproteobacteria bacterium]
MISLGNLIIMVLNLYFFIVVAAVILHWLMFFRVVNAGNQFIQMLSHFLYSATEPVYRRLRRFVPMVGQMDISPIVVIFLIIFLQMLINEYWILPLLRHG